MPRTVHFPQRANRHTPYPLRDPISTPTPCPYTPIDSENGDIRVLELSPGKFDDAIIMRLIPTNLAEEYPTYEALSYVWGTELASSKVRLNNTPIEITANLDCAIRHLRFTLVKRFLWIDALAMNQKDIQERNHQVRIMGRIYSAAEKVIIWLGPVDKEDLNAKAVLGAMQFYTPNDAAAGIRLFEYMRSVVGLLNERSDLSMDTSKQVVEVLERIISRPWFHRVWVVQELALAKKAVVYIGHLRVEWQLFSSFIQLLPRCATNEDTQSELVEKTTRVVQVARGGHFSSQLCRTIHLSATDPRDKVFGILGISSLLKVQIIPDYSKSVQRVFTEAAAAMLLDKKPHMYCYAPLQPLPDDYLLQLTPRLPSWVPDLRISGAAYTSKTPLDMFHIRHRPDTVLGGLARILNLRDIETLIDEACKYRPQTFAKFSPDLTKLFVTGVLNGIIVATSADHGDSAEMNPCSGLPKSLHVAYDRILKPRGVSPVDYSMVLYGPSFHHGEGSEFKEAADILFEGDIRSMSAPTSLRRKLVHLCSAIKTSTRGRTVFLTDSGRVGLAYHSDAVNGIRTGDILVGLFNINFPFILRGNSDGTHQIINVAGVMNKEVWGNWIFGKPDSPSVTFEIV